MSFIRTIPRVVLAASVAAFAFAGQSGAGHNAGSWVAQAKAADDEAKDAPADADAADGGDSKSADANAADADAAGAVEVSENARRLFKLGVSLLEDAEGARNEEAYRAFKAAYADSPTPKILGNLGLCAMRLERDQEAQEAWTKYLAEVPDAPASFRSQVEKDLETINAGIVRLTLKLDQPGVSLRDERRTASGKTIVNRYGPFEGQEMTLGIRAGNHRLVLTREGFEEQRVEVEATPGGTLEREITFVAVTGGQPQPPPGGDKADGSGGIPAGAWIGVGVTGALAVATGVSGGLALAKGSEFDEANGGADPAAATELRDEAATRNLVTDVLLGTTLAAAATTIVLFIVLPADGDAADETALRVGPVRIDGVAPLAPDLANGNASPTALTISGRF